jgi:catechol 2,3-dioxygenase-like lactoylglutathione lyase family enzyme
MYDHIGLRVRNLDASARFYEMTLKGLDFVRGSQDCDSASFGPKGQAAFYLYAAPEAPRAGAHIAFSAPDRKAVDRFHALGLEAGAKDNGKPGVREDYSPDYYAAFLIDLDGNNIEAVCYT